MSFSLGSIACFVLPSLNDNQALDTFLTRVSGMIETGALKARNGTTSKSKNGIQLSGRVKHKYYESYYEIQRSLYLLNARTLCAIFLHRSISFSLIK